MTGSISQKTQEKNKQSKTNKNKLLSIKNAGSPQRADVSVCEGINELYTWLQFCIEFFINPPVDPVIITRRTGVTETPAFDTQEGPGKRHVTSAPSREWNITTERSTLDKMSYLGTFRSGGWWQVVWNTRGHESQQINSPSSPHSSQ